VEKESASDDEKSIFQLQMVERNVDIEEKRVDVTTTTEDVETMVGFVSAHFLCIIYF